MSRDIPFFEMFAELQLSGELRLKLAGAVLTGACIDQSDMSIALRLTTRAELGEDARAELKRLLMGVYGFRKVDVEVTCKLPAGPLPPLLPRRPMPAPPPMGRRREAPSRPPRF